MSIENYFIKRPTAIDKKTTNIRFKGSNNLRDKRITIKNVGKVRKNAAFLFRNILNRKKKNKLTIIFIIMIVRRLEGVVKKAKVTIELKIINKKISFFPILSLASLISFYYNWKLWSK